MNLIQKARFQLANLISPHLNQLIRNKFNEAFLWGAGGFTQYDNNGKSYLEKGYNFNPLVYSIINQQAIKTASIPFEIKRIDNKKAFKKLNMLRMATKGEYATQQKVQELILQTKAFTDEDIAFPMEVPNISQTWVEFLALYKTFLKLTGNVYIYMLAPEDGANKGTPIQVYILPSHLVQIVIKDKTDLLSVDSPVSGYILINGSSFLKFESKNIIHIKYSNPNYDESGSHLYGQSPLRASLRNIQSSNISLDLNIKTLKSGGAFGFIHAKNTPITKTQAKSIKERLLEMNASPGDMSKIAGISAEIGFTRLSLTSDELKPFDYLKFDKQQIADVLNWSIDDENRGDFGGTINEIKKTRITDNIKPDLDLLSNALNSEFLPRFKGFENTVIEFDIMQLPEMQSDTKDLVLWLKDALDRGVINRNEFRLAINYAQSDDKNMDVHTVAMNTMSLEEALDDTFTIENIN